MDELYVKKMKLEGYLKDLGSLAVAFSSGVDSTFLLKTAKDVLRDNVIAVTVRSHSFPAREADEAAAFCEKEGNIQRRVLMVGREMTEHGLKPWYMRAHRWNQVNLAETDPRDMDIDVWRNYWRRNRIQGTIINAVLLVAGLLAGNRPCYIIFYNII